MDHAVKPGETPTPVPPAKKDEHAGHRAEEVARDKTEMAHAMGHGTGESMDAMVSDMRRRFFITLPLALLIYLYTPVVERLIGQHHAPSEGVERLVALDHHDSVQGILQLHEQTEIKPRRAATYAQYIHGAIVYA